MVESPNPILQELLDEELGSDPATIRGLTNHLPMALVAKERLGAGPEELARFAVAYSTRLAPLDDTDTRLDATSWHEAIGQRAAASQLRRYFDRLIAEVGQDDALRSHLPALLPGVGGAAFHGVIRLSYALEVSSPSRVAAGLAYLAEVGAPLGALGLGPTTSHHPLDVLEGLSRSRDWSTPPAGKTIDEEMRVVASNERFNGVVASLELVDDTGEQLAHAALRVYASSNDFTALHGVTGVAAIASLRPWVDDQELLSRYAFQALVAAYLSIGAPPLWSTDRLDHFAGSNRSDPDEVRRVAAHSDDEHVAKLVYTAFQSWDRTRDPLYLAVAARKALPTKE